ncbi:MAG: hypothetical protein L0Y71_03520 [Gemmataceae bacterium]|nr:hypothetical protein [Gemmataceae bacterium]
MSHLLRGFVREELSAIHSDALAKWLIEETEEAPSKLSKIAEDCEHFWIDVGGEG